MHSPLNRFAQTTADWRQTLRTNKRKTVIVISLFFLVYAFIGVLADLYACSTYYPPGVSLFQLLQALMAFQPPPVITLCMLAVAGISLLVTFALHDRLMLLGTTYRQITPETARSPAEQQLWHVVEEMKIAAGLPFMPRVFLIEADYMNALASGYSAKSAMVAITTALVDRLTRSELQAVMAHELSHIRHMDIRLTLMASVLANLGVILLDMLFYSALYGSRRREEGRGNAGIFALILVLRWVLPLINIVLLLYLSRTREYMADAGAIQLTRDNQPLASALLKIAGDYQQNPAAMAARQATPHEDIRREAWIFDPVQAGFGEGAGLSGLFSTHPSLAERLKAIGFHEKSEK